jgi:hypothetical protein
MEIIRPQILEFSKKFASTGENLGREFFGNILCSFRNTFKSWYYHPAEKHGDVLSPIRYYLFYGLQKESPI